MSQYLCPHNVTCLGHRWGGVLIMLTVFWFGSAWSPHRGQSSTFPEEVSVIFNLSIWRPLNSPLDSPQWNFCVVPCNESHLDPSRRRWKDLPRLLRWVLSDLHHDQARISRIYFVWYLHRNRKRVDLPTWASVPCTCSRRCPGRGASLRRSRKQPAK